MMQSRQKDDCILFDILAVLHKFAVIMKIGLYITKGVIEIIFC